MLTVRTIRELEKSIEKHKRDRRGYLLSLIAFFLVSLIVVLRNMDFNSSRKEFIYDATDIWSFLVGEPGITFVILIVLVVLMLKEQFGYHLSRNVKRFSVPLHAVFLIAFSVSLFWDISSLISNTLASDEGNLNIKEGSIVIIEMNDSRFRFVLDGKEYMVACGYGCLKGFPALNDQLA